MYVFRLLREVLNTVIIELKDKEKAMNKRIKELAEQAMATRKHK